MRTTFLLLLDLELYLSLLHVSSACALQPPPLSQFHVMWFAWFAAPLLALTNMFTKPEKAVVQLAQGKNSTRAQRAVSQHSFT